MPSKKKEEEEEEKKKKKMMIMMMYTLIFIFLDSKVEDKFSAPKDSKLSRTSNCL